MSFYFTFYWLDVLGQRQILRAKHESNMDEDIVKWIEIDDCFPEGFLSYLKNFLRSKTNWCSQFVGIDIESQCMALEPYFGPCVRDHKCLLLSCTYEDLKTVIARESPTWYWPFTTCVVQQLQRFLNYVDDERNDIKMLQELNILFHFD